jgi:hypothetical protein
MGSPDAPWDDDLRLKRTVDYHHFAHFTPFIADAVGYFR